MVQKMKIINWFRDVKNAFRDESCKKCKYYNNGRCNNRKQEAQRVVEDDTCIFWEKQ